MGISKRLHVQNRRQHHQKLRDINVYPAVCQTNSPKKTDIQNASKPDWSNREKGISQFITSIHRTSISADKLSFQYGAK